MEKSILLTGASGGFGRCLVAELHARGHRVLAALRGGETRGESLFPDLVDSPRLKFADLDLCDPASIHHLVEKTKLHFGKQLDVLINNAGAAVLGPVEHQSLTDVRRQFDLNFFGPLALLQALLPVLRSSRGRILNVTSMTAYATFPFYGTYSASKHALDAATEALYYDLAEAGVQVCAVEPGAYRTGFTPAALRPALPEGAPAMDKRRVRAFEGFLKSLRETEKDPRAVARRLADLCEARRIPPRVRIGRDAHFFWFLRRWMPDVWWVRGMEWFFRRRVFR